MPSRLRSLLLFMMLAACATGASVAEAVPQKTEAPPATRSEGARAWGKLGERVVQGGIDRDTLVVGQRERRFTKIQLRVEQSDLELFDIVVTFGDGTTFSPGTRLVFKEGSRSRDIDLPGNARVIEKISFRYGNLPGNGKAHVAAFGEEAKWTKLGTRVVQGAADRDVITVGASEGRFSKIQLRVDKSDLELFDIVVTFGDGSTFSPGTRLVFKEGSRSRDIDLPGERRAIEKVVFRYGNLPKGGKAQLELFAD